MKTVKIEIHTLSEQKPEDGERVMLWNVRFREWHPQTYNEKCECWDTEDGDDYDLDLNDNDIWFSLPGNPKNTNNE